MEILYGVLGLVGVLRHIPSYLSMMLLEIYPGSTGGSLYIFHWLLHSFAKKQCLGRVHRARPPNAQGQETRADIDRRREVRSFPCNNSLSRSGFEGVIAYRSEPQTNFQKFCRLRKADDLQHFTRTFLEHKVER